jgi:predicted transport protein
MPIYKIIQESKIKLIKENDFTKEKELQKFVESNCKTLLNLYFVTTEFEIGDFRIDTVAFDDETKSFKIIEFKNVKNHSLVDQGYTYLKLLLERKADFVLKYNEVMSKNMKISEVDWSQSRIIFISPVFTTYQLNATNFKNIPVDLIKVTKYDEDLYLIENINKTSNVKVNEINFTNNEIERVNKEIIVYSEEDHLKNTSEELREVYYELKDRILSLDNIDMDIKKIYIAFKGRTNIVDIEFYKKELKVYINLKKGMLKWNNEINEIVEDISNIGHCANGDYRIHVKSLNDIDYLIPLIKQSLKLNKK